MMGEFNVLLMWDIIIILEDYYLTLNSQLYGVSAFVFWINL